MPSRRIRSTNKTKHKPQEVAVEPEKTANISRRQHWFPGEMTSEKRAQNFHTGESCMILKMFHYQDLIDWNFASSNKKHYPDLRSRFLNVISRENLWWHLEMAAVLSGYCIWS